MTDTASDIANRFDSADADDWRDMAIAALKGEPFDSLIRRTRDGIARGPVFFERDLPGAAAIGSPGHAPFTRGGATERDAFQPWDMRAVIPAGGPDEANQAALSALQGGASSLMTRLDPTGLGGVAVASHVQLARMLDGVMLDLAGVWLFDGDAASAALLASIWEKADIDRGAIKGGFGLSPISMGALLGHIEGDMSPCADAVRWTAQYAPNVRALAVRADIVAEAGGTAAQEIAWMAGESAACLKALIAAGIDPDRAAASLEIRMAVDSDVHHNIAKLRAARRVFSRIAGAFGASESACGGYVHAITARNMMSAKDAWTNLLRTTAGAFAACAAGADSITVRPLTEAAGAPDDFALRLAANIQILLNEESHMGRVIDPAGGSFLHERLSDDLARKAWTMFQEVEAHGGLAAVLKTGEIQAAIADARDAQARAYQDGEALLGVNRHLSDFDEPKTAQISPAQPLSGPAIPADDWDAALQGAKHGGVLTPQVFGDAEFEPLRPIRWAEAFDA